ncbi:MAG: hypothetical protein AAFO69_09450 [Bacteroidota bacterium]
MRFRTLVIFLFFSVSTLEAQDYDDPFTVDYDTPLTIDLESEDEEEENLFKQKKPKRKKKVFYGLKTKRGYARTGQGNRTIIDEFRYLKEPVEIDPYVRDIYWYNFKKKKIMNSRKFDPSNGVLLHGPYKKRLGEQIIEEGIYYKGMKHGRWVRWDKYDILRDKQKFYKGWPKQSKVVYYDRGRKQLREIIPVQLGEREGNYFAFHESGRIAAKGEFHFDHKVGVWTEYYDTRRRKKREIQYPEDPFDEDFEPYIIREWDEKGTIIYDREKHQKELRGR